MNNRIDQAEVGAATPAKPATPASVRWVGKVVAAPVIVAVAATAAHMHWSSAAPVAAPPPPSVAISAPLQRDIEGRLGVLGQFSAVNRVELRAQVGGTLTQIHFKDGDIVHKGDLLFEIDPEPYQIKLNEGIAQLESANARLELATRGLNRFNELRLKNVIPPEDLDQRVAEKDAAQAAVDNTKATIADAKFDLDRCRITAPFTGQIGIHLVSVGNLIAGSRAASSPTTLLATLVSLDPIYLDFDMSESDYLAFSRERASETGVLADRVEIALSDDKDYTRQGTLDFVDNVIDRSS